MTLEDFWPRSKISVKACQGWSKFLIGRILRRTATSEKELVVQTLVLFGIVVRIFSRNFGTDVRQVSIESFMHACSELWIALAEVVLFTEILTKVEEHQGFCFVFFA